MESWEADNGAYLAAGLAYLRECLARAHEPATAAAPVRPKRLASVAAQMWWDDPRWSDAQFPPALELLGDRLGMSRFERLTLLLAASAELEPHARADRAPASFGLALTVLPGASWDALSPERPLRYWRLVKVHRARGEALTEAPLSVDERVLGFLMGLDMIDARLGQLIAPVGEPLADPPPPSQALAVERIVQSLDPPPDAPVAPVVELVGADRLTRRWLATIAASDAGLDLCELLVEALPRALSDVEDLLRLWRREALLLPRALYIDVAAARSEQAGQLARIVELAGGVAIVGCDEPWQTSQRGVRIVDVARPTPSEQRTMWEATLGDAAAARAPMLAGEFDLNQAAIRDAAALAAARGDEPATVWDACKAQARHGLDALALRVVPRARWEDLVMPEAELQMLHRFADQVRGRAAVLRDWDLTPGEERASALTALFAGPSGTGKTLAAEVLAGELDLDLYRIDLAGVVSKHAGETERNLRRVFAAAEGGGVLLMFDAADAMFGRRSEVRDSHDRYANIEVSYLLTRLEDYRGVAILASNQRGALDPAFMRRLRLVVEFPFPAARERSALWERAFPPSVPVGKLDIPRLARLPASGGMIRNIALNAACCAAGTRDAISMPLVLEMALAELRKLEFPLNDAGFATVASR
jgi:hypothetical protein